MADDILLNPGSGGDSVAADEIGGKKHQRVKVQFGDDGSATDVSSANKLPVLAHFSDHHEDAFDRLKVSMPFTQFDFKQVTGIHNNLIWTDRVVGGGSDAHVANIAATRLSVGTPNGDSIIHQTRQYFNYQSGKGMFILMTGVMGSKANTRRRIGYFDDNNGLFFEHDGTNLKIVRRTNVTGTPVDNPILQSAWNVDKLDGTGASGITLDISKTQIFALDFQWLGVGKIRYGFDINGEFVICHQEDFANSLTEVWMSTPNLPIRFELTNIGISASSSNMDQICFSIQNDGGEEPIGIPRHADMGLTGQVIGGSLKPLLAIRLKAAEIRSTINSLGTSLISSTNSNFHWNLTLNPTITGGTAASWTSVSDSVVEYDVAMNGLVSGGTELAGGYGSNNNDSAAGRIPRTTIPFGADIDGVQDMLVLSVAAIATTDTFFGTIEWKEIP